MGTGAPEALERKAGVVSQVSSVQSEVFLLPLTYFSSLFWIFTSSSSLRFLNPACGQFLLGPNAVGRVLRRSLEGTLGVIKLGSLGL